MGLLSPFEQARVECDGAAEELAPDRLGGLKIRLR
jgi:hypothetical protein